MRLIFKIFRILYKRFKNPNQLEKKALLNLVKKLINTTILVLNATPEIPYSFIKK